VKVRPSFLILLIALFSSMACAQNIGPDGAERGGDFPRKLASQKSGVWQSADKSLRAYITIDGEVVRSEEEDKPQCDITYTLWVAKGDEPFKPVKKLDSSEDDGYGFGGEIIGLSRNHRFLAVNFYEYAGDWTGHRPVILNVETGEVAVRDLGDRILKQLPHCDYFQEFRGATSTGDARIHIPKSSYVDEGCPDQGDWIFEMKSGAVYRVPRAHRAAPKKSKSRTYSPALIDL